jgi:hypothetical protein
MTAPLDYAPRQRFFKTRRFRRAVLWTLILAFISVSAYFFGPGIYRRTVFLYWQHCCMTYVIPPGTVAMDMPAGGSAGTSSGLAEPVTWRRFLGSIPDQSSPVFPFVIFPDPRLFDISKPFSYIIMMHQRSVPGGERLVVATAHSEETGLHIEYDDVPKRYAGIGGAIFSPGSWNIDPHVIKGFDFPLELAPADSLRVYTGQPDPANAAAFTVDFDLNGVRHTARFVLGADGKTVTHTVMPPL